ncbi:MAG: hypothetical protein SRB2_01862 [Desulfobacteraceae bacterium Eth-SRB2]|nr:MAG: hypothetical protein SRB2_01862 [Desulfobacteraceae bacterium Eth-SRB2]
MSIKSILLATYQTLLKWPKPRLIKALESLKTKHIELEAQVNKLKEENAKLKQKLEQEKIQATNKQVNKPSSKQAEWEKGCSKGKDKSKKKRKRRKPRKGAGNCPKNKEPNGTETATVEKCDLCGKDLSDKAPLESYNERIIEDIPDLPEETKITLVKQEKKYCDECQEVITAKSDLALPKADIGLNATVLLCYLSKDNGFASSLCNASKLSFRYLGKEKPRSLQGHIKLKAKPYASAFSRYTYRLISCSKDPYSN